MNLDNKSNWVDYKESTYVILIQENLQELIQLFRP